jgi:hypothetical protein
MPRKKAVNFELAEVADIAPTNRVAMHWFGSARRVLSTPLVGEEDLFAEASLELARMRGEVLE